jgi:hypothetical protein
MELVMTSWPHKQPARAVPSMPSPPPKLKSTLPLEQGAWVSWQHGNSEPPMVLEDRVEEGQAGADYYEGTGRFDAEYEGDAGVCCGASDCACM